MRIPAILFPNSKNCLLTRWYCTCEPSCSKCWTLQSAIDHPQCIVLRDQDTVLALKKRLEKARRVLLLGNGGIALELVHALCDVEVSDLSSTGNVSTPKLQCNVRYDIVPLESKGVRFELLQIQPISLNLIFRCISGLDQFKVLILLVWGTKLEGAVAFFSGNRVHLPVLNRIQQ